MALPGLTYAHPGHHAGDEFAAWLRHVLLSPDHVPTPTLAGLVIALGVVLMDRWAAQRDKAKRC